MKNLLKAFSVLLSVLTILSVSGCKKSNKFVLSGSHEYFPMKNDTYSEKQTGSNDNTSENGSNKKNNSSNRQNIYNIGTEIYDDDFDYDDFEIPVVEKGFTPVSIPSRANAYKLTNTYSKMKNGETVNVVYYGGSVTSGTGSSNSDKNSWRALTTAYLKSVSSGKVNDVNAALGGTGTYMGAARYDYFVLSAKPDLLFIEFAINDSYSNISPELSMANLEYMINKLYLQNPYADIVLVLVTNESRFGATYPSYNAHVRIANYYNIPIVDLGRELYNTIKGSSDELKKVLSDSVHPNDKGYKIYADIMTGALQELFTDGARTPHTMPTKKLCENGFTTLENILAGSITAGGWECKPWFNNKDYEKDGSQFRYSSELKKLYPNYLAPASTGASLTVDFEGNSFGMLGTVKEGAWIQFTLDGSTDKFIKGNSNPAMAEYPVFENLTNTHHSVKVTVGGNPPYIAIASFVTTKK